LLFTLAQFSAIRTRGSREQRQPFLPILIRLRFASTQPAGLAAPKRSVGGGGREGGLQTKIKLHFRIFRQALGFFELYDIFLSAQMVESGGTLVMTRIKMQNPSSFNIPLQLGPWCRSIILTPEF
jgi:hypothetical protein